MERGNVNNRTTVYATYLKIIVIKLLTEKNIYNNNKNNNKLITRLSIYVVCIPPNRDSQYNSV